jgi:tetratricopeptide (TPR) repeat protein
MRFQPARCFLLFAISLQLVLLATSSHSLAELTIEADSQYRYAQSRLDAGAFDEAIAEFNRFIHFFPADPRIAQARFQTGMAHLGAGRYPTAAAIFDNQTTDYNGSPLDNEAFFMLSRSHAGQGMIEQAILDLHNLMALTDQDDVIDRARYELGWLHVDQGRWHLADQEFTLISADNQDRFQIGDIRQALSKSDTIPLKNPATAGMLSILPGGGQLYSGRYQDALTAFLINGGLIWAAWEAFDSENYALGSVIGFVEFGFYAGNINGAISSAHKYNNNRISEFKEILNSRRQVPLSLMPTPGGAALRLTIHF